MKDALAAKRYAKSLIWLSKEKNVLKAVFNDMSLIEKTVAENKDLQLLLQSPVVNTDKKQTILTTLFKEYLHDLSILFLNLLSQ